MKLELADNVMQYMKKKFLRRVSIRLFQTALLAFVILAFAAKGFCQTYQFSTTVSGGMGMDVLNLGGNTANSGYSGVLVNFSTLTETIIYDPVNLTLRQIGYLTVTNPDETAAFDVSYEPSYNVFIYGSVTVQEHLVGGFVAFDTGTVPFSGDTNNQYFSYLHDLANAPTKIAGTYSLATGGQTNTGDFSPTLSFSGPAIQYSHYFNIATNGDSSSLTMTSGDLGYTPYINVANGASTGVIMADNGLSIDLRSGSGGEGDQNFGFTGPASVIATLVTPPVITSIVQSDSGAIISGTSGFAGGAYHLLSSTNLTLPLASWTQETNGFFDGNGNFSVTNYVPADVQQKFYRLTIP